MDLLVVVIPKAFIAGGIAVTVIHDRERLGKDLLKGPAVLCNDPTHMAGTTGHRIVENHREEHSAVYRRVEQAPLDVGTFYPHLLGQALKERIEDGAHCVQVTSRLGMEGDFCYVRFEIVGKKIFRPFSRCVGCAGIPSGILVACRGNDVFGISADRTDLEACLSDHSQGVVRGRFDLHHLICDLEGLLADQIAVRITDIAVLCLEVMLRAMHGDSEITLLCEKSHAWL